MADHVGQQLGNYRLIRFIKGGGFGDVYLGEHVHLGTQAAIKVLRAELASQQDIVQFLLIAFIPIWIIEKIEEYDPDAGAFWGLGGSAAAVVSCGVGFLVYVSNQNANGFFLLFLLVL